MVLFYLLYWLLGYHLHLDCTSGELEGVTFKLKPQIEAFLHYLLKIHILNYLTSFLFPGFLKWRDNTCDVKLPYVCKFSG